MEFKKWLEDAGEVHGGPNSEDAGYCAKLKRHKHGAPAHEDSPEDEEMDPKMGFMKRKMKRKMKTR